MSSPASREADIAHWTAARLPAVAQIRERLQSIFPAGVDYRSWATAERAARSLYVFLYTFAVEHVTSNRLRPAMVTTMSDAQAARTHVADRLAWWEAARRPRKPNDLIVGRWYAENTREPIRDETFRAWKEYGALLEDQVATTASTPRYQLARDFADLFDPHLEGEALVQLIASWQARHLTVKARARVALILQQAVTTAGATIRFPDGATRVLAMGPSTPLVQAAIERFTPTFLRAPVVLAVTESRKRLAYDDAAQLRRIGLAAEERLMPDLLLADLDGPGGELRLVFVECVATGGPMSSERVRALSGWLETHGLSDVLAVFGTVFADRNDPAFHRYVGDVAWGTFVWCASEPENVLVLLEGGQHDPRATLDALTR